MMTLKHSMFVSLTVLVAFVAAVGIVQADVFNMPAGQTSLQFVPVGNINNAPDPSTGYGSVGYDYSIGKCEITAGQYTAFLNAIASTSDSFGLYNRLMASTAYGSQIIKNNGTFMATSPNQPINYVSWGDAARFCNWLQNGQKTYAQDPLTTENGSYTLSGYTDAAHLMTVTRNPDAKYVIPNENEWYKAAYYDPNKPGVAGYWLYPTKSDTAPTNAYPSTSTNNANCYNNGYYMFSPENTTDVGSFANSLSAYNTLDQGGNVYEWNETAITGAYRGVRGGSFKTGSLILSSSERGYAEPLDEDHGYFGFRIVSVPEPSTLAMLLSIAVGGLLWWKRRNA